MQIKKGGFTLIELIVGMIIIAVLSAILYPAFSGYIDRAQAAVDVSNLRTLNVATTVYEKESPSPSPFEITGNSADALMQVLIDSKLLDRKLESPRKDFWYQWDFDGKIWVAAAGSILTGEQIFMGSGGHQGVIKGSYSGSSVDIVIPKSIDDVVVTEIYQDVFNGKSLTSVTFSEDSVITRIHARAFKGNNLTEITFPDSLRRIDYGAFLDNDIVKIEIGSDVYMESNVFRNDNKFRDIYLSEGAGTYLFADGDWTKQ